MTIRRHLRDLLTEQPRSVSSLARELGMRRRDVDEDLHHALRTARAADERIEIVPARCKDCGFTFAEDRLLKPGRCPECKGSRLFEAQVRLVP